MTRSLRYLGRRLLRAILLLAAVSVLCFCLVRLTPGTYYDEFRVNPSISSQTVEILSQQHGLNQGIVPRYVRWATSALAGNWGFSVGYNTQAGPLLWARAKSTLVLTGTASFFAWIVAISISVWGNCGRSWRGVSVNAIILMLLLIPELLLVLIIVLLAGHSRLLPIGGMTSPDFEQMTAWQRGRDLAGHLVVPGTALALAALPMLLSHAQAAIADVLQSPFVNAARASGIRELRLLLRHVLPVAANPLITLLGFSVGTLLSSSLLVEAVAGWPGLGQLLLQSILQRDLDLVVGAVMLSAVFFVLGNLLGDILLYAADPRIREER
jgi:peptide/nickel transport system permease protein